MAIRRIRVKGESCIYCGEPANVTDHFPPKSSSRLGWILPCCEECNVLAGIAWPHDFMRRTAHVKAGLREKYRHALAWEPWTPQEIRRLRQSSLLMHEVTQWLRLKKLIPKRLAWNAADYLATTVNGRHFAASNAETNIMGEGARN